MMLDSQTNKHGCAGGENNHVKSDRAGTPQRDRARKVRSVHIHRPYTQKVFKSHTTDPKAAESSTNISAGERYIIELVTIFFKDLIFSILKVGITDVSFEQQILSRFLSVTFV